MKTNHVNTATLRPREQTWNGTITDLSKLDGRVYVRLSAPEIGVRFLQQSEAEGFTFTDGAKPTSREAAEIMAVNPNRTLNYVGTVGRIAYGCAGTIGGKPLIRIRFV